MCLNYEAVDVSKAGAVLIASSASTAIQISMRLVVGGEAGCDFIISTWQGTSAVGAEFTMCHLLRGSDFIA